MSLKLDTVNGAIYTLLSTDATLVSMGVTPCVNYAPEDGVSFPYIIWNEISITPDDTFTGRYWNILIQFDCYAQKKETSPTQSAQSVASDIAEALCSAMDGASFTLTGLSHICNRYEFQQSLWEDTVKAARVIVEYKVIVGA